ncbi:hypothetical protein ACROYT_G043817 [Oculina patagonica]
MEASGSMKKPEKQRVAIFLDLVGEEALEIYNTFSLSTAEQKLDVLFQKFEDYCNPRRNITFERHKFFTCVQEPTEGIDQYVTELRTKASTCEIGVLCESLIRDRIVCGILCDTMREKLLQENDLSLQKAIDMCRASEFSKRQTKSITEESKSVDYVDKKATQSGKFPPKDRKDKNDQSKTKNGLQKACKRCGTLHAPRKCPAYGKICLKCKNRNHFASQCLSKNVHLVESDQAAQPIVEDEQLEELFIGQVQKDDHGQEWKASLQVNNNMVEFKLDTGAQANVIPSDVFNSLKGTPQLKTTKAKLTGFSGSVMPVLGVARMICKDEECHDEALRNVLERAREKGVKLKKQKCEIKIPEVVYIGDKITKDGIKPDESKIEAILYLPSPQNKKDVERLLGMVLTSKPVLSYYDVNKPVKLSVDASQSGLGAVLLQDNQPVACASKSLTDCQKGYAQIEKETLAIEFGCERFHQYLYGKEIEVESDHKPLEAIFAKPIAKAPPRIQGLLLRLQHYQLNVKYVPGKLMFIADALSRVHLETTNTNQGIPDAETEMQIHLLVANLPISEQKLKEFQEATKADQPLQTVAQLTKQGWPDHKNKVPADAKPYWSFKEEIHEADGILFKSHKMIVPERLRPEMLKRIHESHLEIEKSKRRARDILYWPNMNAQITEVIANCSSCLKHRKNNTKEPLIQHEVPDRPWQKIACDLFTLGGKAYLLTVDYYSIWVEIGLLRDSTLISEVITQLKSTFARYGIPDEVISDNGPQLSTRKFKQFADSWEFKHTTTSPKHPQANEQVEKAVGTAKSVLKKVYEDGTDPYIALLENRNTPITGLSYSPA